MYHDFGYQQSQLDNVNRLIAKRDANGGYAVGFHGSSATRTSQIIKVGFEDRVPERGGFRDIPGVYFWDEEYAQNALSHGEDAAKEDGDLEFAVIQARLYRPAPDYEQFRPQWRAEAVNIGLMAIRFYDLATREEVKVVELTGSTTTR